MDQRKVRFTILVFPVTSRNLGWQSETLTPLTPSPSPSLNRFRGVNQGSVPVVKAGEGGKGRTDTMVETHPPNPSLEEKDETQKSIKQTYRYKDTG